MTHAGVPLNWQTIPGDRLAPWGLRPLDREAAVEFVELIVRLSEGSEVLALCEAAVATLESLGAEITTVDVVFDTDPVSDFLTLMGACQLRTMRPLCEDPSITAT